MNNHHKSIFISYRRSASAFMAQAIFQHLHHGYHYNVFLDVATMGSGNIKYILLNQIRARTHFILLLAPGTLERCAEPNDWLRREIETALETDRNIILLFTEHFNFKQDSQYLSGKLADLQLFNGFEVTHNNFNEAMEKLRTRFLINLINIPLEPISIDDAAIIKHKLAEVAAEPPVKQEELNQEAKLQQLYASATEKWRARDYKAALADCETALNLNPNYADAYMRRGTVYKESGQYEAAIEDFNIAITLNPDYAFAYNNRGLVLGILGKYKDAINDFDVAINLNPEYAEAYNNRGMARGNLSQYEASIEDFNTAISLKSDFPHAYNNRAESYFAVGNYTAALKDFQHCMVLKPNNKFGLAGLAITHHHLGNVVEARIFWEKCANLLDSNHLDAAAVGKELNWPEALQQQVQQLIGDLP